MSPIHGAMSSASCRTEPCTHDADSHFRCLDRTVRLDRVAPVAPMDSDQGSQDYAAVRLEPTRGHLERLVERGTFSRRQVNEAGAGRVGSEPVQAQRAKRAARRLGPDAHSLVGETKVEWVCRDV